MHLARSLLFVGLAAGLCAPATALPTTGQENVVPNPAPCVGDPTSAPCVQSLFISTTNALTGLPGDPTTEPTLNALLANLLAGNPTAASVGVAIGGPALPDLLVPLSQDPCDAFLSDCVTSATGVFAPDQPNSFFSASPSLNILLTQQQQALLGCGEFYGTNCETDGIDLYNAELSGIFQSWTDVLSVPQPCARFVGGAVVTLPGCRGPGSAGYDPSIDGSAGLIHPLTGEVFPSELAALSWNALVTTVALSSPVDGETLGPRFFDPELPLRIDGCSFARPGQCATVQALTGIPEPGTALTLGVGLVLLASRRRS